MKFAVVLFVALATLVAVASAQGFRWRHPANRPSAADRGLTASENVPLDDSAHEDILFGNPPMRDLARLGPRAEFNILEPTVTRTYDTDPTLVRPAGNTTGPTTDADGNAIADTSTGDVIFRNPDLVNPANNTNTAAGAATAGTAPSGTPNANANAGAPSNERYNNYEHNSYNAGAGAPPAAPAATHDHTAAGTGYGITPASPAQATPVYGEAAADGNEYYYTVDNTGTNTAAVSDANAANLHPAHANDGELHLSGAPLNRNGGLSQTVVYHNGRGVYFDNSPEGIEMRRIAGFN